MNTKTALMLVAGSVLVHAAVTACTATTSSTGGERNANAQKPPAADAGVEVSAVACETIYEEAAPRPPIDWDGGPTGTVQRKYAEQAYPGKTKEEIAAHVSHWTTIDESSFRPQAYRGGLNLQSAVYTRDGFAGAGCEEGKISYFVWRP